MPQYFIKVSKRYSTKNKVQKLCLEHLEKLTNILSPDFKEARNVIEEAYKEALSEYKGNALVPSLRTCSNTRNMILFYIEDVIYIDVYEVLDEL